MPDNTRKNSSSEERAIRLTITDLALYLVDESRHLSKDELVKALFGYVDDLRDAAYELRELEDV